MRVLLVLASLVVAVVVQVSVLNGLILPGGGVPDLVLVLVCALAMAGGPVNGMLIGFAAGLCVDLAPPGSELVGQYALIFCLAGWAAGRLRPAAFRTARHAAGLAATGLLALVIVGGEVLSVAFVKVITPSAVSLRQQVRLVLPSTIAYDLVLLPFVLSVVMLAAAVLARLPATAGRTRALAGTTRSRRAAKRSGQLPELHLARNTSPAVPHAAVPRQRSRPKLRPAAGVPGSATGLRFERTWAPAPVHIRFAGGNSRLAAPGPGRHPGQLAGGALTFRPHVDRPAVPLQRRPVTISFAGHPGDGALGHTLGTPRSVPARSHAISFASRRGDGAFGQTLATGRSSLVRPAIVAGSVPRLRFASDTVPVRKRVPATPRFRPSASSHGSPSIVPGGVLGESTFRLRRQQAAPRLRLSRVPPGMLGGSGRSLLARPPRRAPRQPRFSYGKRSPLALLSGSRVGRRLGGRWLARTRAGGRSGVWLLGRRAGGLR